RPEKPADCRCVVVDDGDRWAGMPCPNRPTSVNCRTSQPGWLESHRTHARPSLVRIESLTTDLSARSRGCLTTVRGPATGDARLSGFLLRAHPGRIAP